MKKGIIEHASHINAFLPLLLKEDSPALAKTRRVKDFQARLDAELDCLLFRRAFELQCWVGHAKGKLARSVNSPDATTLRRSIAAVQSLSATLVGVLIARRSARAEIPMKPISQKKNL